MKWGCRNRPELWGMVSAGAGCVSFYRISLHGPLNSVQGEEGVRCSCGQLSATPIPLCQLPLTPTSLPETSTLTNTHSVGLFRKYMRQWHAKGVCWKDELETWDLGTGWILHVMWAKGGDRSPESGDFLAHFWKRVSRSMSPNFHS